MPSSPNKGYTQPAFNSEVGTWGSDLNNNFSSIVDNNLGGYTTISLSNSNVTLTSTQAQNLVIALSGALSANITLSTPCVGFFWVENRTTGNFWTQFISNFGSGSVGSAVIVPQGTRQLIMADTTFGCAIGAPSNLGIPAGIIQAYVGFSAPPPGWLLCYGQLVNRNLYANLFLAIGTVFGVGDGSTTFGIPDLRGRTIFGLDNMGGTDAGRLDWTNALGTTGGSEYQTLTQANLPAVSPTINPSTITPVIPGVPKMDLTVGAGGAALGSSGATQTLNGNPISLSVSPLGSGTQFSVMPPAITLSWILKY